MQNNFETNLLELNHIVNQIIDEQPIYDFPQDLINFMREINISLEEFSTEESYVLLSRLKSIQVYLDQFEDTFPIKIVNTD